MLQDFRKDIKSQYLNTKLQGLIVDCYLKQFLYILVLAELAVPYAISGAL